MKIGKVLTRTEHKLLLPASVEGSRTAVTILAPSLLRKPSGKVFESSRKCFTNPTGTGRVTASVVSASVAELSLETWFPYSYRTPGRRLGQMRPVASPSSNHPTDGQVGGTSVYGFPGISPF